MGIDRFSNFILKSINNGIEEISISNNIRKLTSNFIYYDINFIIYQELICVENEINSIHKILLCIENHSNSLSIIKKLILVILDQNHWKKYLNIDINELVDLNDNSSSIFNKFINLITVSYNNGILVDYIVYQKIIDSIKLHIYNIYNNIFIKKINFIFDGIPSLSKIIEQRKRRYKNYLESTEKKKLASQYLNTLCFDNILLKNTICDICQPELINCDLTFNYSKWINNIYFIEKAIGPSTLFIINLEIFIIEQFADYDIKININKSCNYGEADVKIFKHISDNNINGDYSVHTNDSDFIFQMLIQQTYYKILNLDKSLTILKHHKNNYIYVFEATLIIKNILELYNNINNCNIDNWNIIWDICFIFYFFGNDHLPQIYELSPELGLNFFLKIHYDVIKNNSMVFIDNDNIDIRWNLVYNFLLAVQQNIKINISKIILIKYFKINNTLINLFIDKLKYDFNDIINFLKLYIYYKSINLSSTELDNLYDDDLRKIIFYQYESNILDNTIFNKNHHNNSLLKSYDNIIETNINYYEHEFYGLIPYVKNILNTHDAYQNIYNYILDKASGIVTKQFYYLNDNKTLHQYITYLNNLPSIDNNEHLCCTYLKKMYHLANNYFGSMKNYYYYNITSYSSLEIPSLVSIILYIKTYLIDNNNTILNWTNDYIKDNILLEDYPNSVEHYILISPFITNVELENISHDKNKIKKIFNYNNIFLI